MHVKSEVPKPIVKSSAIKLSFFFSFRKTKKKTNFIVAKIKIASKNGAFLDNAVLKQAKIPEINGAIVE